MFLLLLALRVLLGEVPFALGDALRRLCGGVLLRPARLLGGAVDLLVLGVVLRV